MSENLYSHLLPKTILLNVCQEHLLWHVHGLDVRTHSNELTRRLMVKWEIVLQKAIRFS